MNKERLIEIIEECNHTNDINVVIERAKEIAATKNPYHICDFAEFVTLSDHPTVMPILEDGMFATEDIVHCYEFAFCMADHGKKFNLKRFEDLIIDNDMAKLQYYFLECVKGCNTYNLFEAFKCCAPSKWLKAFAENEEVAQYNTAQNDEYLPNLIFWRENDEEKVKQEPNYPEKKAKVIKDAIKSRKPLSINDAAEYYAETPEEVNALFEAMMATDDLLHIYELYCSVPALTEEQKAIILDYIKNNNYLNSAKYMYYISEYTDLPAKEVAKMLKAAQKTGNTKYIKKIEKTLQSKLEEEAE